ncbi:histone acetylation protein-domain-containing protein [Gautieria morchelliformis]|nr:histone acetylation protein-domain-containing protein [Gautieria morchelliformis]
MTSLPVSSLRAHLLSSLTSLPGSRIFHIHVLVSSPRKPPHSLFRYASPRPKCQLQDILILLSEEAVPVEEAHDSPRTFVSAIQACVYTFPTSDSTILYISKVDGTGQGIFPSPTSSLLRAFGVFYASPRSPVYTAPTTHHLWIHLFARSQRQYLFPNSADNPNKKPLGDVALCKWWKKNLSHVAKAVEDTNDVKITGSPRLYYLLPGQSEQEASYLLREAQPSPVGWIYSHPYDTQAELELPFPSDPRIDFSSPEGHGTRPLASLIPYFEDDPKSRFLDELAATSEEHAVAVPVPTPKRKRQKTGEGGESGRSTLTDTRLVTEDRRIEEADEPSNLTPQTPRTPRRPVSDLDTITSSEFWERMSYRQECAQGAVTGFFVAVFSQRRDATKSDGEPIDVGSHLPSDSKTRSRSVDLSAPADIEPPFLLEGTVPHSLIKRVMSSLLTGVEFSTAERSHKGTQVIETAIEGLCEGIGHINGKLLAEGHRISDVQMPERETGTTHPNIYKAHVYASLSVSNPPLPRKSANNAGAANSGTNPPVNVLGVRRKKKRE